jgi:aryl-alcohol dehydrogenase-like predicted oxidoreductase
MNTELISNAEFVLGTVQLGMKYGVQNSEKAQDPTVPEGLGILEQAHQLGIAALDTANGYGGSQDIIGQFKKKSDFKIFSKFVLSREKPNVLEHFQATRQALGMTSLEGYSFHRYQDMVEYPGALQELVQLQKSGMIKNIGVSLYSNEQLENVLKYPEIKLIQLPFNVLDNFSRRGNLLQRARESGRFLYARSAYLQGLLLMPIDKIPAPLRSVVSPLRQLQLMAQRAGFSLESLCMGYILQQKLFNGLVIGVDNKEQLVKNWQNFHAASKAEIDLEEINSLTVEDARVLDPSLWATL